ncbi:MAG: LysR family transcriptional regulator [Sporomusa sp.]
MGLLQLEYFKALAENEHLTQTAKELMVSAPSLSATIARLEEELGCKLFDRDGRKIKLNECGERYLKYTNEILALMENAKKEVLDMSSKNSNHLSIGISSPIVWLDAIRAFIMAYPAITVSHTLLKRDRFKNFSYCSKFDFIITATTDMSGDEWDHKTLIADDKPVIAAHPSHPLASKSAIHLNETKDEKYIAVSIDFSMRKFFEDSCKTSGFTPKVSLECDYILRAEMLKAEYGIVFTTESGARANMLPGARYIRIIDPPIRRPQGIFYNKRNYLSKSARTFLDFMVDYHKEYQDRQC